LERDRVVDLELGSVLERIWDDVLAGVPGKGVGNISEHEGNVVGQCTTGGDVGQDRERVLHFDGVTRDGAIGQDENGGSRVDTSSDLTCDSLLVELVLLNIVGVDEPRGVDDANLGKRLCLLTRFKDAVAYHYAAIARKFVNVDAIGLTLTKTILLVGAVEDVEVVVINVSAEKDIGDEFQE
jgi:hypothetical protein